MEDLYQTSASYGGTCQPYASPDSNWNPLADVVPDGKNDMLDIWLVAKEYGWTK